MKDAIKYLNEAETELKAALAEQKRLTAEKAKLAEAIGRLESEKIANTDEKLTADKLLKMSRENAINKLQIDAGRENLIMLGDAIQQVGYRVIDARSAVNQARRAVAGRLLETELKRDVTALISKLKPIWALAALQRGTYAENYNEMQRWIERLFIDAGGIDDNLADKEIEKYLKKSKA
ncbi:hypothetical protein [Caldithrix abyssi]